MLWKKVILSYLKMDLKTSGKLIQPICEEIQNIKNWFLIKGDSWTHKIALLIFVWTKDDWFVVLGK